jgi:quinoprotein glucose dehydrogenase
MSPIARRLLAFVLCVGLAAPGCVTAGAELTPLQVVLYSAGFLAYKIYRPISCLMGGCEVGAPEGMQVEVWDDTQVQETLVALEIDERGRVFVAESHRQRAGANDNRFKSYWLLDDLAAQTVADRRAYIEKWAARGKDPMSWYTEHPDNLRVIEDRDGDGRADLSSIWAAFQEPETGLGAGVLVHEGDVYYANVPDLWRLRDEDGDGKAEVQERMSTGYGVRTSLSGHDLHGLTWGPDGKIYFSLGDRGYSVVTREGRHLVDPLDVGRGAVFRMHPDGSDLEVFARGLRNPQELAFDDYGNLFTGDNNGDGGDEARLVYVAEGGDTGWSMSVQTLAGDYVRGPWNAERMWHPYHENQPAWILPPVAFVDYDGRRMRGPAGLAYYPGLGLPERYRGHFFLCDYQYAHVRSGVISFAVEPKGAGFEITDVHPFLSNLVPTDIDFAYDGSLYVSEFDQFGAGSRILRARHAAADSDPRVEEVAQLVREGFREREPDQLVGLLGHADRRIRARAQRELARRGVASALAGVANDAAGSQLARLHAIWGLGQLGAEAVLSAGWRDPALDFRQDPELRANAARVIGESGARALGATLTPLLRDESARVRYFAALSLGKLQRREAIPALLELLRSDADADPFLRHAAVMGLSGMGDLDAVLLHADDASPSVRMGVLLALRRAQDARVARYLRDPEPRLVVEAARAVHDLRIDAAFASLASLATAEIPYRDDDPQTSWALARRIISANERLGTPEAAAALASYAADMRNPRRMREEALEALEGFAAPGPRERVWGYHRALPERDPSVVHPALDRHLPALLETDLEARALDVALRYDRVPLDAAQLLSRVRSSGSPKVRLGSLRALAARGASDELDAAMTAALASQDPELRAAARDALARVRPDAALIEIDAALADGSVQEKQRAVALLGQLRNAGAISRLERLFSTLRAGSLAPEIELDVLEAARAQDAASLQQALAAYEASLDAADPLVSHRFALAGGDAERGRAVFERTESDCMRCHAIAERGGAAGPELTRIGARLDAEGLLEAVLEPQARVAVGFGSVSLTLDDGSTLGGILERETRDRVFVREPDGELQALPRSRIANQLGPASAMPPMGRMLPARDLRDLLAYLVSLR